MRWKFLAALGLGIFLSSGSSHAQTKDFLEDFATAKDRTLPLKQLIPKSQDYYYYHALHYQNETQLDRVDELLREWEENHSYDARRQQIKYRQLLLRANKDNPAALEELRKIFGVSLYHTQPTKVVKRTHPSRLPAAVLDTEALTRQALARTYGALYAFHDTALYRLLDQNLTDRQRTEILQRLSWSDHPKLAAHVASDLRHRETYFGSLGIHKNFLLSQLDELAQLRPSLWKDTTFVYAYLRKLRPSADVRWKDEPEALGRYLDRLWSVVGKLSGTSFDSLKLHLLKQRLLLDRQQGKINSTLLLRYLRLPRNTHYTAEKYVERYRSSGYANVYQNFSSITGLPVGESEETLLRSLFLQIFSQPKSLSLKPYSDYLRPDFLRDLWVEARLTAGLPVGRTALQKYSLARYKTLQERVDIDFAPTNPAFFPPTNDVQLDLAIKNVKTLIIKVYAIHASNYYKDKKREVRTDLALDGLVAHEERTVRYNEDPIRRVRRQFSFPALKERGVYVIDFIGEGKSSRTLIQKGRLRSVVRDSIAGQLVTILDEAGKPVPNAFLWLAGKEYKADAKGTIAIPYSTRPQQETILLGSGTFVSLDSFFHKAESYALHAGIYVDREALLKQKTAQVVVRPSLTVNGQTASVTLLTDVTVTITATDHFGTTSAKVFKDVKWSNAAESVHAFRVPEHLSSVAVSVTAKVKNLSQNKDDILAQNASFTVNQIDRTDKVHAFHLSKTPQGYALDILDQAGFPRASLTLSLTLYHKDFRNPLYATLQTDDQGRVWLGSLDEVTTFTATTAPSISASWTLRRDQAVYPKALHGRVGDTLAVPFFQTSGTPDRADVALIEKNASVYVADRFGALKIANGYLTIGDLAAGDYELVLKREGTTIPIRLTEGAKQEGVLLGKQRTLEATATSPLHITSLEADKTAVKITVAGGSPQTRVHVIATRYVPEFDLFASLRRTDQAAPQIGSFTRPRSFYLTGRDIGDEYRYILERKYAKKFPSILLERPGLLLHPWALRTTQTDRATGESGVGFGGLGGRSYGSGYGGYGRGGLGGIGYGRSMLSVNLDFLAASSVVLLNLTPNKDGVVTIPRSAFQGQGHLHVIAIDPRDTVFRTLVLDETPLKRREVRLRAGLDPKTHYVEQSAADVVQGGKSFHVQDIATSQVAPYDSLASVYRYLTTVSQNATLKEFEGLLRWPTMKDDEKKALYTKYASHEMNFFLFKKDPVFFRKVVAPGLQNKKDKTFLDAWLLGMELTSYLEPAAFGRLNTFERILLGQRLSGSSAAVARLLADQDEMRGITPQERDRLFQLALQSSALDASAFEDAKQKALDRSEKASETLEEAPAPSSSEPAAPPPPPAAAPMPSYRMAMGRKRRAYRGGRYRESAKAKRGDLEEAEKGAKDEADIDTRSKRDEGLRAQTTPLFRQADKTKEWAENNYYHLPIEQQNASLIGVKTFWKEYAAHPVGQPFVSPHFVEATSSFPEMVFALAVLDLPFQSPQFTETYKDAQMTLLAKHPLLVFHKQIKPSPPPQSSTSILVSQQFFLPSDRFRYIDGERTETFVEGEFLTHTPYGSQIILTNPTSSQQKLHLLFQIPRGSLPLHTGKVTYSLSVSLAPYQTHRHEFFFFFPRPGSFAYYPVHAAKNQRLLTFAPTKRLSVVTQPTQVDQESWAYVADFGTTDHVLAFLQKHNLLRLDLQRLAWRLHDKAVFHKLLSLLRARLVYHPVLWGYAFRHPDPLALREVLQQNEWFVRQCGLYLRSPLLNIDPVERRFYQHLEYAPLINARTHAFGKKRTILNDRFRAQYNELLTFLTFKPSLHDDDRLALAYYLLLQDRFDEAVATFRSVGKDAVATRLQYDYFAAYLALAQGDLQTAKATASAYLASPLVRWKNLFTTVVRQVEEIEGKGLTVVDPKDRTQKQTQIADTQPTFDFKLEGKSLHLTYKNLDRVDIHFYPMDIELLFSRSPFLQLSAGQFAYIRPNASLAVALPKGQLTHTVVLPEAFQHKNVLVEVTAAGQKRAVVNYASALLVDVAEQYGMLKAYHGQTGKPLPKVYIKVYARLKGGEVRFYKDGYTDLRGRFDYASLSTDDLDHTERLSILVLSDQHGAIIREAAPPKQ